MKRTTIVVVLCSMLLFPALALAGSFETVMPTVVDPAYGVRLIVPGSYFHGTHGLKFDNQDNLYVGSVAGVATYRVNCDTGRADVFLGPPEGGADDIAFGPDGRVYWTAFFQGKIHAKGADGRIETLAENLPGINSLNFSPDGRLFATQVFMGDALWEIDLSGKKKHRRIAEKLGGLNSFMFGPDGLLYGPLWFKGQVVRVDVKTGAVTKIAEGLKVPSAVKFDSKGNLYALESGAGYVDRIDAKTGKKTIVAKMESHLDNLAFDSKDRLFVTNMASNGVYQVCTKTGKVRTVAEGLLALPQGIAVASNPDGDLLYLADNFSYKRVDVFTGQVQAPHNGASFPNGCALSQDGKRVLMTSWFTRRIQVFDSQTDEQLYAISGFKALTGALLLADGTVLALEGGPGSPGCLVKVTDKEGKTRAVVAEGLEGPTYLALAGPEEVYVTEYTAGRVSKVNFKTGQKKVVCSGLSGPEGIAVKADGKLLVVDTRSRQLLEIDPASGAAKPLVVNLAVGLGGEVGPAPPATWLTGLAVSKSGAIYIASDLDNAVYQIYPK